MKTIIYNQSIQQFHSGIYPNDYLNADGQLSPVQLPLVKLQAITSEPIYTPETQVAELGWDVFINPEPHNVLQANGTATQVWNIRDKTAVELAREQWHHITPLRIHAPKALISSQQEMAIMLLFREIKRVETETGFYLYINEIAPEDAATFAYLQGEGIITVENYPGG
jgi:hypothetical protein